MFSRSVRGEHRRCAVIPAQAIGLGFGKPQDFSGLQARFILFGMSQSLSCVLIHIVFSTKDRAPLLDSSIRPALNG